MIAPRAAAPVGALVPWRSLAYEGPRGALYGVHERRALTRWRTGALTTGAVWRVVRGEATDRVASPALVDWTGWVDEPGRRGGASGAVPEATRATVLLPRVARGVADALAGLAARTGETRGAIVARLVLAEVERVGE